MVLPSTIERIAKKKFRKYSYNSEDDNLIDRLSELPEDLLVRILSLLSLKEVLRICGVSRKWRDLCRFFSRVFSGSLNFEASKTLMSDPKKLLKERDGCVESINQFFNLHKAATINELRVCFDLTQQHRRYINRWIEIALMKKCERLELDFDPFRLNHRSDSENYRFRHKFSISFETRVLTGLCLKHVDVSGLILESFLSNCPLLETLHVSHSKELTHISVCGSSLRLKYLHVSFCKCITSIELRDVSYGGQWDSTRDNIRMAESIVPSCLATSQLVNLTLYIPIQIIISRIQPKFSNLRCLTFEFRNVRLPIERTWKFVEYCKLMSHMPLLQKLKVELEVVAEHILTEVRDFQSLINECYAMVPMFKRFGHQEPTMLQEVEIVGFVGAQGDTFFIYFLSLFAPNLERIVINRGLPRWYSVDERKLLELEEARMFAYDLLSAYRPTGAKFLLL